MPGAHADPPGVGHAGQGIAILVRSVKGLLSHLLFFFTWGHTGSELPLTSGTPGGASSHCGLALGEQDRGSASSFRSKAQP